MNCFCFIWQEPFSLTPCILSPWLAEHYKRSYVQLWETQPFRLCFNSLLKPLMLEWGTDSRFLHIEAWTCTMSFHLFDGRRGIERLVHKLKQFHSFVTFSVPLKDHILRWLLYLIIMYLDSNWRAKQKLFTDVNERSNIYL